MIEQLTHRSCSTCIYWSDVYRHQSSVIRAVCELKQNPEQPPSFNNFTRGGDTCGQWKKVKWVYDPMYDRKEKDYT